MDSLCEQKKYLKKWFSSTADRYDTWGQQKEFSDYEKGMAGIADGLRTELDAAKKLMAIKRDDFVLDVATGTGNYLIAAAQKGAICYGIDISEDILNVAREKVKRLGLNVRELKTGDSDNLPYPDKFFDWITCIGMFDYYPMSHSRKILLEFRRVLKDGGRALIDFPDINNPTSREFKRKSATVKTKVYLHTFDEIKSLVEGAGFDILEEQIAGPQVQLLLKAAENNK